MKTWTTPEGSYSELYKMMLNENHLLIAGASGSGKSVVLNGIITSALYNAPCENQMILIDPKRVELSIYKRLPHVMTYATEIEDILSALNKAVDIMESRYVEMEEEGIRKYKGSHIYIIIDEFADLILTDKKNVDPLIQRLAQLGRAANIHVILATQCVLAEIISTKIKCNFPSRVALKTSNAQDSRNILDRSGAEMLPRYGQCIFQISGDEPCIYNVPMGEEEEIDRLITWWIEQK